MLCAPLSAGEHIQQDGLQPAIISVTGNSFDGEWLNPEDQLTIRINRLPDPNEGDLHLVVGNTDVTSLLQANIDNELILGADVLPLPQGASDVVLYLVTASGEWRELARLFLQVRSDGGFETAEFKPRLELTNKGQLDEGHSLDAGAPARSTYQDLTIQTGFTSNHTRGDLAIRSSFNLVGSTVQEEALRFSEKADKAPRFDLSDYLLEIDKGRAQLAIGHIFYGNNPLLLNSVGNRGVMGKYRFNDYLDFSISSMNGTSVVGYPNFIGQQTRDHNITAATFGVEMLKSRPGGLRMELTYLDASIESQFNFDVGEVPDAETNRGLGLRVSGSNESGRLRGDFSIARSRYRNPVDAVLAQGDTLVEVAETTDTARHLELAYDLLQNKQLNETLYSSLTFTFTHDRADPLYKSVGAFAQPDWYANQFAVNGQVGHVNLQLQHLRGEDNLDNVPTVLKTKTQSTVASVGVSLVSLFGDEQNPSRWWPTLSYVFNRVHQYASNNPAQATSAFNGASHLPDQVNTSHGVEMQWSDARWNLGYRLELNDQDNRQIGRDLADFKIITHDINAGVQATDTVSVGVNLSLGRNADREQALDRDTLTWALNADWRITPQWAFSGSFSTTRQDDSQKLALSTSDTASAQLNWNFKIPAGLKKLPGQFFLRYSLQGNDTDDRQFGFQSNARSWSVNSGISMSLF